MEVCYRLIDIWLPWQWLSHGFMKNALLAILLVSPLFGLLGTAVVNNRLAFFSDALGHSAFTGIALGVLIGLGQPQLALIIFSILFAVAIMLIKNNSRISSDTVIGVFASAAIALGLVLMSRGGGFNKFSAFLIGDLLSITSREIAILAVVLLVVLLLWLVLANRLLVVSINPALAASRNIRVLPLEMIFAVVLAVVVAVSIQWVGILVINSLLVLPAATARNLAVNYRQHHFLSVALAIIAGVSGLIISYYFATASGPTIVLVNAVLFVLSMLIKR